VRPPKLAIRTALGVLIAAAILALGAVSASAAPVSGPNPGYGAPGATLIPAVGTSGNPGYVAPVVDPAPSYPANNEPTEDGPQTADVPTLAWAGEEVKLVACDDSILAVPFFGLDETASFRIAQWTGDQAFSSTPTFTGSDATNVYANNNSGSTFFFPSGFEAFFKGCVSTDVQSTHTGLSVIDLTVDAQCSLDINGKGPYYEGQDGKGNDEEIPCSSTVPVYSEKFIVIWMQANAPVISEASTASISAPGSPGTDAAAAPGEDQLSAQGLLNLATGSSPFLGDPSGNGVFGADGWGQDTPWGDCQDAGVANTPDDGDSCDVSNNTPDTNNGLIDIRVTGSFPVEDAPPSTTNENEFAALTGGTNPGTITLPKQWAALADVLATGSESNTGIDPSLWDIHGGPTNTLVHVPGLATVCSHDGTVFTGSLDAVDDCASNGISGNPYSFSRVFGDLTILHTIGPYDDEDPAATLLSDGRLNSDDAPMPALPITVSIEPNAAEAANEPAQEMATVKTDPNPLGGVGGLYGVEKWLVYSHDFDINGNPGTGSPVALTTKGAANLYNPYYQEFIPSTLRPISEASGIDGVYDGGFPGSSGDDFPGFSNGHTDAYTFWQELANTTTDTLGDTNCLRRDDGDGQSFSDPTYYNEPYYPTNGIVYTDERGEAYVDYNPGTGFYLNNLGIPIDRDTGCDLQNILGDEIGESTISAQAEYPYDQPVPYTAPSSNTLTKVIDSKWSKTLTAYPKEDIGGTDVSIFVVQATDINGQPFVGETVCFSFQPGGGFSVFNGTFPGINGTTVDTIGADPTSEPAGSTGYLCALTNDDGQAAVEVPSSENPVDVIAWFVNEHLYRNVDTTAGDPTPVTSVTPPTVIPADPVILKSGNAGSAGSGSSSAGGSGPSVSTGPGLISVGPANSCKVNSIRLHAKSGYVTLKVSCTVSKTDKVTVRTYRKDGRLLHSYTKTVAVNKTVTIRIKTLKVARVKVSV